MSAGLGGKEALPTAVDEDDDDDDDDDAEDDDDETGPVGAAIWPENVSRRLHSRQTR